MRAHPLSFVMAASLALSACGQAAATPDARRAPTTSVPRRRVVPMVRETKLPSHPPAIALTFASGVTQRGVRYTTDFRVRGATTTQAPHWPVPWPAPAVSRAGAATLKVYSVAVPDDVMVRSWSRVVPDGHEVPDHHSAAPAHECYRFTAPRCAFTQGAGTLRLVVPARAVGGPFIAVYVQWHIPEVERLTGAMASADATATWLFRVRASTP